MTDPRPLDLASLNSATKYPSIPTHHTLGERGLLREEVTQYSGEVVLTEKVDGTNGRVVLLPGGDYVIGSREDLLHARGDRIHNPALGIVDALKPLADALGDKSLVRSGAVVLYAEVYGDRIGAAAKQYQSGGVTGHRLFDIARVPADILDLEPAAIAAWREGAGQSWLDEAELGAFSDLHGIPLTPRLTAVSADQLPLTVQDTYDWLARTLPQTLAALDIGARGTPEGIVLRDAGRATISKARFKDYQRTLAQRTSTH